jgi:FtsP/CotA-like multicopper oxidase with cupredoxin domain
MPVQLEMPFKFAGDFVYHCHILSHEDAGMMNKIRIATNP